MLTQELFDRLFLDTLKALNPSVLPHVLPLMRDAVNKLLSEAKEPPSYSNENGPDWHPTAEKAREKAKGKYDKQYETYQEYLDSPRWKALRKRIFTRDKRLCLACGNRADEVHHRAYDRDTMAGRRLHMLVSLCRECHEHIHFTCEGEKVSAEIAEIRLSERRIEQFGTGCQPLENNGLVNWKALIRLNALPPIEMKGNT